MAAGWQWLGVVGIRRKGWRVFLRRGFIVFRLGVLHLSTWFRRRWWVDGNMIKLIRVMVNLLGAAAVHRGLRFSIKTAAKPNISTMKKRLSIWLNGIASKLE